MNHPMSHNLPKRKFRFLAGILFCFLLSLEYSMAQGLPEKLGEHGVPKGSWNILLIDNVAYNQWNYLPSHKIWNRSFMMALGIGAGLEYAYCRNRTLALTAEVGITGFALTMEPSEWDRRTRYYNINHIS